MLVIFFNINQLSTVNVGSKLYQPNFRNVFTTDSNDAKHSGENDVKVRLINDHQTELLDSGLGESNNQRTTFDFSCMHHRRSSLMSLEHPEFSDQYRCIISPNAPSSESSSLSSDSDDPWTRRIDIGTNFSFEEFDIGVSKHLTMNVLP